MYCNYYSGQQSSVCSGTWGGIGMLPWQPRADDKHSEGGFAQRRLRNAVNALPRLRELAPAIRCPPRCGRLAPQSGRTGPLGLSEEALHPAHTGNTQPSGSLWGHATLSHHDAALTRGLWVSLMLRTQTCSRPHVRRRQVARWEGIRSGIRLAPSPDCGARF